MTYRAYEMQLSCLGPVAVRLGQDKVHAPEHSTWGVVTCDVCGQQFAIGPNRTFAPRTGEEQCVRKLEAKLAEDHTDERPHDDYYEVAS